MAEFIDPVQMGHVGEHIATVIFDIQLMHSAAYKAIDGRFRSCSIAGRSVNIKWHSKQEREMEITLIT